MFNFLLLHVIVACAAEKVVKQKAESFVDEEVKKNRVKEVTEEVKHGEVAYKVSHRIRF